jgi:hypothetical protein
MSSRLVAPLALVLAGRLAIAPFAAAEDAAPAGPIRAAATHEAARLAEASRRGAMPNGLKWTGIGMLTVVPLPLTILALTDCAPDDRVCGNARKTAKVTAGVLAGTGTLLLVIGHHKRPPRYALLPEVTVGEGRAAVVQRITF